MFVRFCLNGKIYREKLKNRAVFNLKICYNRENKYKRFIMTKLYGSLEAGGTKFVCAVGDENYNVVEKVQFPTTTPIETIDKTIEFFSKFENLAGLAIGSFGPIDIDKNSKLTDLSQQLQNLTGQM